MPEGFIHFLVAGFVIALKRLNVFDEMESYFEM
jgi:hypothetical protein